MAFSFPNYQYQPYPQQGYGQNYPQMQQQIQPPAQQPTPQIQNGGFVSVRSEIEARNYPVAPGNSVTFKDEYSPYVYTKTMGFSSHLIDQSLRNTNWSKKKLRKSLKLRLKMCRRRIYHITSRNLNLMT